MLRLCVGIVIFALSSYCGYNMSDRLRRRADFLRSMSDALAFISREIEFGHYSLEEIFERIGENDALHGFFCRCRTRLSEHGIRNAWSDALEYVSDHIMLTDADKDAILMLGSELGMTDIRGQKNAISRSISHIDKNVGLAESEYLRLGKTYKSCGMLMGVFFLIIVI